MNTSILNGSGIILSMAVRWKLKEFLDANEIKPYHLADRLHGELSQQAVYRLAKGVSAIKFETLNSLIPALSEMTKRDVQLTDIMEYVHD